MCSPPYLDDVKSTPSFSLTPAPEVVKYSRDLRPTPLSSARRERNAYPYSPALDRTCPQAITGSRKGQAHAALPTPAGFMSKPMFRLQLFKGAKPALPQAPEVIKPTPSLQLLERAKVKPHFQLHWSPRLTP